MRKLQNKPADNSQIPNLKRWEFKKVRELMGIYKNQFATQVGKHISWPGKIEKHARLPMPLKYIFELRNMNPELFYRAYSILSENKNLD